jgi:hypothetical protein
MLQFMRQLMDDDSTLRLYVESGDSAADSACECAIMFSSWRSECD